MQDALLANLVGADPAFLERMHTVRKLAACDVTVLIQGETGTGKELAARAIHYLGARRDYPFIPVNCGAIPDDLAENELFGHVRGAFTDARDTQPGLVASAERGTLFLDEIECLSPRVQTVLLRFLQDRVFRPLGARQPVRGDVRVVAASNADVAALVETGAFRRDLMYRLAVTTLTLPPLRDRPADVPRLARHFLRRFAREYGRAEPVLDAESEAALLRHDWPGNVRELENLIHRELVLAEGPVLRVRPAASPVAAAGPPPHGASPHGASPLGLPASPAVSLELGFRRAKAMAVGAFERAFLASALAESGGNVSRAARLSGKERRAFGRLLKKHGLTGGSGR